MKQNDIKLNKDKGFTLIELLIAITILAIIVGPLLHAFVTAAKTNAKAKEIMRATTIGQNVMEEIKAYSLEDIARQFNHDLDATPKKKEFADDLSIVEMASAETYEVLEAGISQYSVIDSEIEDDFSGVFVGQSSGKYEFRMENVQSEHAKFDVKINLTKNSNGTKEIAKIREMNRDDCAYYAQDNTKDEIVAKEFKEWNDNYGSLAIDNLSQDEFLQRMSREIAVNIEQDESGNQTVQVQYTYTIPQGYVPQGSEKYVEYSTIFDNYASHEELQAVYIYYYPLYGNYLGRTDSFKIVNESNLDVDVYLIRIKNVEYTAYKDTTYNPYISVVEKEEGLIDESATTICTNIKAGNGVFTHSVSGISVDKTDLGNESSEDIFYDVEITIYKHDTTAFEEENRITSFTGSLLDTGAND